MEKKIFSKSGLPLRRTVDLLPEIFKSSSNDKFLSTTLDALTQPGTLDRLSGYVGRSYGKTFNSKDIYLDFEESLRHAYQLEPAVVIQNNGKTEKFFDYIDLKNQIKFFNNINERDDITTDQEHYSWNPPIDWDKFINYREYYWLPTGPDLVPITGQAEEIISKYRVRSDGQNEWLFIPDGLKRNPQITLYRGQTYEFQINSPGDPFYIRSGNLLGTQENYNKGVTNNGVEVGTLVFQVPLDAPDQLYYQSSTNINRVGLFTIASITENSVIDIEKEILGKVNYTSSNGIEFTNGLRVEFVGKVTPEIYKDTSWIVEGVGSEIKLVNLADLEIPPIATTDTEVVFDDGGFDVTPFDDASTYPISKDYITINRASLDRNPWSRYNRWFHRSTIEYAANFNNIPPEILESARAKRPIIEFSSDIKLFNHGSIAKKSVDFIDTFTTDVFSTIEGSSGYYVDGQLLSEGDRVLFTADTDLFVKDKIFVVKFITTQLSTNITTKTQISLVEADDSEPVLGEAVIISKGSSANKGRMFHYDGNTWVKSQTKTSLNQPPLFDMFDDEGVSFADISKYETSTFAGTEIVSYKIGSGPVDTELGFSIAYMNINNSGDILFEADCEKDSFSYQTSTGVATTNISSGFYKNYITDELKNGWEIFNNKFEQPVIQTVIVDSSTNVLNFTACEWVTGIDETILFYVNGEKFTGTYTNEIAITGRKFTFDTAFAAGDAVTIKVYSSAIPNRGFYEIPMSLEKNPLNETLTEFTLGQANDHLRSMIEIDTLFVGEFPGNSNLRDISGYEYNGRRFIKHSSLGVASIPLLCDKTVNVVQSLRFAANEYEKFKNNFLKLSAELPFDDEDVVSFVDTILKQMTSTKTAEFAFSNSDMIGSGAYKSIKVVVEDEGIKTFALTNKFDLSTPSTTAVYVYVNNEQLLYGRDYEFDSTFGFVKLLIDLEENDVIEIREYFSTAFNFIPETPTKLGLYKKFTPEKYLDTTFVEPTEVIQGHDGSLTVAFGDFRDDLLLELERRIYNNIKLEYSKKIFDVDMLVGSYNEESKFTKEQVDSVLEQEFLKWSSTLFTDVYTNNFYIAENSFTYTFYRCLDKKKKAKLPQFWRGIFKFLFDTDRPHTHPWEMLGFSEKPMWWEDEYGPAPYTRGNLLLWEDLRDGIIRQGDQAGTYPRYARSDLLLYIPVDDEGNLVSPQEAGAIIDYTLNRVNESFQFGDWSPTENAWRRSSQYPFALMVAASVLQPISFISSNFDRTAVTENHLGQIIDSNTGTFVNLSTLVNSLESNPLGLFTYIQNHLKVRSIDVSEATNLIENIDVKISHRIGGFVEKERQKYILDSKNPKSKTSGVFIPYEDFEIIFNESSPTNTTTYSGVVIEKVDGGFKVSGYDRLNSVFEYYDFYTKSDDPVMSVGGVSESYLDWTQNKFYGKGLLVKNQSSFYRVITSHTSGTIFDSANFTRLPSLPLVGSVNVVKRTQFNKGSVLRLSYNTIFNSIQEVVDFLLGYGEKLKSNGFVFDEFNKELGLANDWETSSKEFMFWTTHNWAVGSIISLSPASAKIKIVNTGSVAENILDNFYDYSIFRSDGSKLSADQIQVYRGYNEFYITPVDPSAEGIYFAKINFVQKEHVAIFNDRTVFNDVIFDKGPGYRQERLKLIGFRTADWDGDYTSPGFIFDEAKINQWEQYTNYRLGDIVQYRQFYYVSKSAQNGTSDFNYENWERLDSLPTPGLVANFDYKINQIEDYYEVGYQGIDDEEKELARHTIGYQKRTYLQDLAEDEVSQFRIYQGFIREKGTQNSITKIFDKLSSTDKDAIEINEEWAFKVGYLGGYDQSSEVEFIINQKDLKLNPQSIILDSRSLQKDQYRNYILLDSTDFTTGGFDYRFPTKFYDLHPGIAGYVNALDVDYVVKDYADLYTIDPTALKDGTTVWVTFDGSDWDVIRYTITDVIVGALTVLDTTSIVLETNKPHNFQVGEYVGINNIKNLEGFWQIKGVGPTTIVIAINGFSQEPEIDQSSFANLSTFESLRVAAYGDLISDKFAKYPEGTKVWIDDTGDGKWGIAQKRRQYVATNIKDYGVAFPTGTGRAVSFVETRNEILASNPGEKIPDGEVIRESAVVVYAQSTDGLIPIQNLAPVSNLQDRYLGNFGEVLASSQDGRWVVVGSPRVSYLPSNYKEEFDPNANYNQGDIVLYAGKLWVATETIVGDGSTINLGSEQWTPATINEVNPLGVGLSDVNQGYREQGSISIYEYDSLAAQYILRNTLISPRPAHGERFGSSISIGKQEGIPGSGGDVTLTVTQIDSDGGIAEVSVEGETGLNDAVFSNVSGTDISLPGSDASFDITKTGGVYNVIVRSGGSRYAIGDRIKVTGSNLDGVTPFNDLLITITNVTSSGEIVGSATYTNVTGINSTAPEEAASFTVNKVGTRYAVTKVNSGLGYLSRSIVRYSSRLYACIKDTRVDLGVWSNSREYLVNDVVKFPADGTSYYKALQISTGVEPSDDGVYWTVADIILPTNTDHWEQVSGVVYATEAVDWNNLDDNGDRIQYTAGTVIVIPGSQLGGQDLVNDITIRINTLQTGTTSIDNYVINGVAAAGIVWSGTPTIGEKTFNDVQGEDVSDPGLGAIFNLARTDGIYSASISVPGTRYNVGDKIRILGAELGGTPESYFMVVGAPGSKDNIGRAYLYNFDGLYWKQYNDTSFIGVYSSAVNYEVGSKVWYGNSYWVATANVPAVPGNQPGVGAWEETAQIAVGMFPATASYTDDGSTLQFGNNSMVELLTVGSQYGSQVKMTKDGSVMIIAAPYNDTSDLETYKGIWRSTLSYSTDDVVLRNDVFYKALVDNTSAIPETSTEVWEITDTNIKPMTGAVYVYERDTTNNCSLVQIIDADSFNLEAGDEFGRAIDLSDDGSILVISSPNLDLGGKDQGGAFIFERIDGQYVFDQQIDGVRLEPGQRFGSTVSISRSGNVLSIAAEGARTYSTTIFDSGDTAFDRYLTHFRDESGKTGKVFVYTKFNGSFILSEILDQDLNNDEDFGKGLYTADNSILVGSPKYLSNDPAFDTFKIGRIQKFDKDPNAKPWYSIATQSAQVNINLLKNLALYDKTTNTKIADLDILDPAKGKILSVADQYIDYKTAYDPAIYSVANELGTLDDKQAWKSNKVGTIWWDLSAAKWTLYEQRDISYRNGNWGAQAYGSSIDVYEWVETELLPSEWAAVSGTSTAFAQGVSGTPLHDDDTNYSVTTLVDTGTGLVNKTLYYYWVKNKSTAASQDKKLSSLDIAGYINYPLSAGLPFAALTSSDTMSLFNVTSVVDKDEFLVNLQFFNAEKGINLIHNEYQILSEGTDQLPTEELENKWIDSLVGEDIAGQSVPDRRLADKNKYGINSRPRQGMFIDRNSAVNIVLDYVNNKLLEKPYAEIIDFTTLNSYQEYPNEVRRLYDAVLETEKELQFITTSKIKTASLRANIINGRIDTVDVVSGGYGYKVPPTIKIVGTGTGAVLEPVLDRHGSIISVNVLQQGRKYLTASLVVRPYSVLVKTDTTANNFWSIYSLDDKSKNFFRTATQSYDTRNFWTKLDWWLTGYSNTSRIEKTLPGLYAEPSVNLDIGQLLRLDDYGSGGWAVLKRVDPADSTILGKYQLVGRELGTIQILNKFYNTSSESTGYDETQSFDSNKYDTSTSIEFRNVLAAIKNDIFVGDLKSEWNKLFFATIHYVFSEQLYVDWAFKTSFVSAKHNVGSLVQKINYKNDNLTSYQSYIEEVKPYRTKIRNYTSVYDNIETSNQVVSDFDLPAAWNSLTQKTELVDPLTTDSYPWKSWKDNYAFSITDISIIDRGQKYTSVPQIFFEGGGGAGAKAQAYVSNGKVSKIVLTSGGYGYTSVPTVLIVGGVGTEINNSAKAIAILGDSKARLFDVKLKFDRISKTPTFESLSTSEKFAHTETFTTGGKQTQYILKYPLNVDRSKVRVTLNGDTLLQSEYSVSNYNTIINNFTELKGQVILNVAPTVGSTLVVAYEKSDDILDSLNRIDKHYAPTAGQLGVLKTTVDGKIVSDYSQLITGIDFGGVIVQGATFDVGAGWDALPWFTEGWDSSEFVDSDFYFLADSAVASVKLPTTPAENENINIYVKRSATGKTERLDPDVMNTFVGDGSTSTILIPVEANIVDGDVLIFRPESSDGSLAIGGRNNLDAYISGGDLSGLTPYSTATGRTAAEIVLDGDKFISPEQVPAPEENVPGQVIESVSIKVFHTTRSGAPAIVSRIYESDGVALTYNIGQDVFDVANVIVFVDKVKQTINTDYIIQPETNVIRFLGTPPVSTAVIEIFSLSVGGIGILDYKEFIGDGSTRYFLTGASFSETQAIYASIDSIEIGVGFVNSNGRANSVDQTLVEFAAPPEDGAKVIIIVLSGDQMPLVKINHSEIDVTESNKRYAVPTFSGLDINPAADMLVELNGQLLTTVDTTIVEYDGVTNSIQIGVDVPKGSGSIIFSSLRVYINGVLKRFGLDYTFTSENNTITLIKPIAVGSIIKIEDSSSGEYSIDDNAIVLSDLLSISTGDVLKVTWFERYTDMDIVKDQFIGGKVSFTVRRDILDPAYMWVYKNGERLTQGQDFRIELPRTIYLTDSTDSTDLIETVSFGSLLYKSPLSFEIFKDVLNRNHYTRYRLTDLKLAKDLAYYEDTMTLVDASELPTPTTGLPGIVTIAGEKIQYLEKDGNVLKSLRRGLFGTSIKSVYTAGTSIVNSGFNEFVPYTEPQEKEDFVSDGTSQLIGPLTYVPMKSTEEWYTDTIPNGYGRCDQIEVFVGGRRLRKDSTVMFDNTVGAYSPAGDIEVEAEFSVDGTTEYIRLTDAVPAGTRITVIRRIGRLWYDRSATAATTGQGLSNSNNAIAKFLQNSTTKLP